MSLVDAAPASESPPPTNYLALLEALVERLWGAFAPHEVLASGGIFYLYLALLTTWRLDYLCQQLTDRSLPPPPELPRPQPAERNADGAARDA
ncbi:hypothetical protein N7537_010031 [Penicillium hordei]|uniref:Uncharacterized protein n=1 Tax=Penicillium hordei TaxID=40994 RepID=A0AAD6DVE3_9EURO|nr:uncharacterized protein N7537_010031 [Penicillium hordei]KAJ5593127.1 hypothetical protein N7537_010031 [Penicillium hordei]